MRCSRLADEQRGNDWKKINKEMKNGTNRFIRICLRPRTFPWSEMMPKGRGLSLPTHPSRQHYELIIRQWHYWTSNGPPPTLATDFLFFSRISSLKSNNSDHSMKMNKNFENSAKWRGDWAMCRLGCFISDIFLNFEIAGRNRGAK